MKRTKRMVLVPEDVLSRYEQKQKIETSPPTAGMMQQDTAMSGIIESENLTDAGEKEPLRDADVIAHLPVTQRPKAAALLKIIENCCNCFFV